MTFHVDGSGADIAKPCPTCEFALIFPFGSAVCDVAWQEHGCGADSDASRRALFAGDATGGPTESLYHLPSFGDPRASAVLDDGGAYPRDAGLHLFRRRQPATRHHRAIAAPCARWQLRRDLPG